VENSEEGKQSVQFLTLKLISQLALFAATSLEEVLRAGCSLSHTCVDLAFLPAATRMIDRDDAMFSSEQYDFFRPAKMLYQRKYPNSKGLVKRCPSLPTRVF
jgi:hypothetical protein